MPHITAEAGVETSRNMVKPKMVKNVDKVEDKQAVIIVTGPTACGKSGLALALAKAFNGVVINADSMQTYRELSILTARPDDQTLAQAPHRLYGVIPGAEACSAGRWRDLAVAEIDAALAAGKRPIVVGGTGLYLRVLEQGLAEVPDVPATVRAAAEALHAELGGTGFHEALSQFDPVMAARLRPGDTQRLIRAWEVRQATGQSLADWQDAQKSIPPAYRFLRLVFMPARDALYQACDARFQQMVTKGAEEEVRAVLSLGLDPALPVMKAVGVPELGRYLAGQQSLETAIADAQQATRRYAKRQFTWLRNQLPLGQPDTPVFEAAYTEQQSKSLDAKIFKIIRSFC